LRELLHFGYGPGDLVHAAGLLLAAGAHFVNQRFDAAEFSVIERIAPAIRSRRALP
jgi:hypothetical protein